MKARGASPVVVTTLTVLALAMVVYFFAQVFIYYRQIDSGDFSGLPQYSSQLSAGSSQPSAVSGAVNVATADDPSKGPTAARLTIVEFLDYQCPFCIQVSGTVREMMAKYHDRVRFIIRDFPVVELHPDAAYAAETAGCAEAQGKFWPVHDRLFAAKGVLKQTDLDRIALETGLDTKAYAACMESRVRLPEIEADLRDGAAAGVRGTPTFFFNGQRVEGVIPEEVFDRLIQDLL